MDTTQAFQNAYNYAKTNPNTEYATGLRKRIEAGQYDKEITTLGIKLPGYTPKVVEPTFVENVQASVQDRSGNIEEITNLREQGQSVTGEVLEAVAPNVASKVSPLLERAQKLRQRIAPSQIATGGQGAGLINDIIGAGLSAITPDAVKKFGTEAIQKVVPDVLAQAGIQTIEDYNTWATNNPLTAKNIEGAVNIASLLPTGGAGKVAVEGVEQGAKAAGRGIAQAGAKAVSMADDVGTGVAKAVAPVSPVVESIGSTIGGAVRRGKEAVVESVQEAQRVAKLPVAEKQAVRSGLDTGVIDFVKTTSIENIPVYQKIVEAAKSGADNLRGGTKAKEVVGKLIVDNAVTPVIKLRNTVGKKLGDVVEILPKVPENVTPLRDEFAQVLESVGVRVGNKGKLVSTRGGVKGDLTAYQNMWDRIKSGYASQREIHDIRSAVFKEFDLAKARQTPFSEQADNVAEQFRSILNKGITNKQYSTLSKQYAELMRPLQDFVKYIGYKGDIEKLGTQNLRVAEIAQRVLGNASARPQEVLDAIAALADKAGKGKLSKDISDAIRFSDLIEDFYGLQQTRSLAGQVAKGTKAGVEGATESVIQGAANGGVTGMVGSVVKGVLGKTTAEQQKALDALLSSLSKTKPKK